MPRDKQYTPEQIEKAFQVYRNYCESFEREIATASGKPNIIRTPRVMTIRAFISRLDINYKTWERYCSGEDPYKEYSRTCKKIAEYILSNKADALINGEGNTSGLIFDLKANHGWKDKQEIDMNHKGERLTVNIVRPENKPEE